MGKAVSFPIPNLFRTQISVQYFYISSTTGKYGIIHSIFLFSAVIILPDLVSASSKLLNNEIIISAIFRSHLYQFSRAMPFFALASRTAKIAHVFIVYVMCTMSCKDSILRRRININSSALLCARLRSICRLLFLSPSVWKVTHTNQHARAPIAQIVLSIPFGVAVRSSRMPSFLRSSPFSLVLSRSYASLCAT